MNTVVTLSNLHLKENRMYLCGLCCSYLPDRGVEVPPPWGWPFKIQYVHYQPLPGMKEHIWYYLEIEACMNIYTIGFVLPRRSILSPGRQEYKHPSYSKLSRHLCLDMTCYDGNLPSQGHFSNTVIAESPSKWLSLGSASQSPWTQHKTTHQEIFPYLVRKGSHLIYWATTQPFTEDKSLQSIHAAQIFAKCP